jgi:hypothetical protein
MTNTSVHISHKMMNAHICPSFCRKTDWIVVSNSSFCSDESYAFLHTYILSRLNVETWKIHFKNTGITEPDADFRLPAAMPIAHTVRPPFPCNWLPPSPTDAHHFKLHAFHLPLPSRRPELPAKKPPDMLCKGLCLRASIAPAASLALYKLFHAKCCIFRLIQQLLVYIASMRLMKLISDETIFWNAPESWNLFNIHFSQPIFNE